MPRHIAKLAILRLVRRHDGAWNWYQISRATMDIFAEYPDLKPSEFISEGLLEEKPVAGEPLTRVHTTELARALIEKD